jgi:16S rRNA A1518/A1519 N6-dimethyltransferase RsmA/KsgA/DIM1 with predicted DNA glycosylase/AP lyase activity
MQVRDGEGAEPAAIAAAVDLRGTRMLEVGCGDGRLTGFAAARATEVYASWKETGGADELGGELGAVASDVAVIGLGQTRHGLAVTA